MNIERELEQMIREMKSRTNGMPALIVCSQDTLNTFCEQAGITHLDETDIEEDSGGYVGRYRGIPIIVSPQVESGKVCLIPGQSDETNGFCEVSFSGNLDSCRIARPIFDYYFHSEPYIQSIYRYAEKQLITEQEELVDIDEDSFLNILKAVNPNELC